MKEFVLITGLSGAGKSQAAGILEDMGFFCVDNLPPELLDGFMELVMAAEGKYDRVALVSDIRGRRDIGGLAEHIRQLRQTLPLQVLFLEASEQVIVNRYKDCKGMILDLRQNGGGSSANAEKLLSIFDCHGQVLHQVQMKAGPSHDAFTEPYLVRAADSSMFGQNYYNKPVAVLVDRGSFSATSFFALDTKSFDNIKLFGDYTGGGLGLPNGGALPNGWTYRFSISRTLTADGQHPEWENGVPPDVRVLLDPAMTAQGIDNIIEAAADWIME